MAEKIMRKVKKLTTFLSTASASVLSATIGDLKIKYFNASPKLIQISSINVITSQVINVFIEFFHED
jgi:ribosome recycling factor